MRGKMATGNLAAPSGIVSTEVFAHEHVGMLDPDGCQPW
ncbi:hypothetical protein DLM_0374 [Aquitalea magnusonii]|uniref:Uncharacterized protein n=1 Tax=Aquitalea magnusonii TaxID=332411 RepID=A0A3G9GEN8_9NEIS|nr:hypothetical protein DLM_0374 [Aquitalea magnusonii]